MSSSISEIYFAGGCFWGTQKLFSLIEGVISTTAGYANGTDEEHATYDGVCSGLYGFRECVKVEYDRDVITLEKLLKAFLMSIDPTMFNRQGMDFGIQYQTGIYYSDAEDLGTISSVVSEEKKKYREFYTEVLPLRNFFPAEEYHQDYLMKNPGGYCHIPPSKIQTIISEMS